MRLRNTKEPLVLVSGDVFFLASALWFTLLVRYGEVDVWSQFALHIIPFGILFVVWLFVFFIAGLYEKQTLGVKRKLPSILLSAQVVNVVIAILFFYALPFFGLAPRTNLFLYLIISFLFLVIWRHGALSVLSARRRYSAVLVGVGDEVDELVREVNNNRRYSFHFVKVINPSERGSVDCIGDVRGAVMNKGVSLVIADTNHPVVESIVPELYTLLFSGIRIVDLGDVYEEIFDRIPLSVVRHGWFLEHLSAPARLYSVLKRVFDVAFSLLAGVISLVFYPFILLAIFLDDGGPFFYTHVRVGKEGRPFRFFKFRTMSSMDTGEESLKSKAEITRVGQFLRTSRLDELPQLWNILRGDLSFVGPRPEVPELVVAYEHDIPHYGIRHLIKPGVTGWAQMYHEEPGKFGVDARGTRGKLSYDLFYIKNRSFFLDLKIILKTLKVFFTRSGR